MNCNIYTRSLLVNTQNKPFFRECAEKFLNSKENKTLQPNEIIALFSNCFFSNVYREDKIDSLYSLNQQRLITHYLESKTPEKAAKTIIKLITGQLKPKENKLRDRSHKTWKEFYDEFRQLLENQKFDISQIKEMLSHFYDHKSYGKDEPIFHILTLCLENSSDLRTIMAYITQLLENPTYIETIRIRLKNELVQFGKKDLISYFRFIGTLLERIAPSYNKWCDALLEATSCEAFNEPDFRPKLTKELIDAFLSAGGR